MKLGTWSGPIDYLVVLMDDFKVVLGLEFLDKVQAFPIPFANSMCIVDDEKSCMVPTVPAPKQDVKLLSAMEFKKGVRLDEKSYLIILKEYDDKEPSSGDEVLIEVQDVLNEFKDVMPNELPKKLIP